MRKYDLHFDAYVQVVTNSLLLFPFSSVFSVILQQSITAATKKIVKALCPEAHSIKKKNSSFHMRNRIEARVEFTRLIFPVLFKNTGFFRILVFSQTEDKNINVKKIPKFLLQENLELLGRVMTGHVINKNNSKNPPWRQYYIKRLSKLFLFLSTITTPHLATKFTHFWGFYIFPHEWPLNIIFSVLWLTTTLCLCLKTGPYLFMDGSSVWRLHQDLIFHLCQLLNMLWC